MWNDILTFIQILKEFNNKFLLWNSLLAGIFLSFSLLFLCFIDFFHGILKNMLNYIIIICLILLLLCIYKALWDFGEKIIKNRKFKKDFFTLSKNELAIIKYLFYRPNQSAWLPQNMPEPLSLLHGAFVEIISQKRDCSDFVHFNLYRNNSDKLYKLTKSTLNLIKNNEKEIFTKWKKLRINKYLDKIQL